MTTIDFTEHKKNWADQFLREHGYPAEARASLPEDLNKLFRSPQLTELFLSCTDRYKACPQVPTEADFAVLRQLAPGCGVHPYSAYALLLISLYEEMWEAYQARGWSRSLWFDTSRDLYYKVIECRHLHGVWGTFVPAWFPGFFYLKRFALGRLQFEPSCYPGPGRTLPGLTLREGDPVLDLHIPSAGPLKHEDVSASYRQARAFFRHYFQDKPMVVCCCSWLLSSVHLDKLPPDSNLCRFASDFILLDEYIQADDHDLWRIFEGKNTGDPSCWPRDTRLQQIYADHLAAGGHMTSREGILIL